MNYYVHVSIALSSEQLFMRIKENYYKKKEERKRERNKRRYRSAFPNSTTENFFLMYVVLICA